MAIRGDELLTIGDISREPEFRPFSRRQIEYAIQRCRICPVGRLGIIRAFSRAQLLPILASLDKIGESRKRQAAPTTEGTP